MTSALQPGARDPDRVAVTDEDEMSYAVSPGSGRLGQLSGEEATDPDMDVGGALTSTPPDVSDVPAGRGGLGAQVPRELTLQASQGLLAQRLVEADRETQAGRDHGGRLRRPGEVAAPHGGGSGMGGDPGTDDQAGRGSLGSTGLGQRRVHDLALQPALPVPRRLAVPDEVDVDRGHGVRVGRGYRRGVAGLLVTGTSSDAGKSLLVTGLCRAWARAGLRVAPFKSQNMSNNSMVCADGSEIGRAQFLQAQAAGVEASSLHNPVLLKPGSDRRAFVVLRGRPAGELQAGEYATGRRHLAEAAYAAYEELCADSDLVVCEGAGSPAEVNLRAGDYVNMGLARRFDLPTLLVTDIDRGGALAATVGTWTLLEPADRALLRGYVVNKFRGDHDVLAPGLSVVTAHTGLPWLGTLPWLEDVWLDAEDALSVGRWGHGAASHDTGVVLRVAVVRLPRASNATDVDALAAEPGVEVRVTTDPSVCRDADLLVLPGSRATVSDLAWLRAQGIASAVAERVAGGRPVLGICGGYEMLGSTIADQVESGAGRVDGLGHLCATTEFETDKVLGRPSGSWRGHPVTGYEIHHGVVTAEPNFPGGTTTGAVWGTIWHGTLEGDAFRRAWLAEVAAAAGSGWRADTSAPSFAALREGMIQALADAVTEHLDLDRMLAWTGVSP